ncbi:PREDICTED: circadian clock-controlled protein-like [Dinoponera quadriceps]|uniref:Circadian clock-controlled protein-like n=1 Tax=Dinoponera quadriceps TaxID=609295 RepID=A0A6P3X158_DINQU|nr:PREDICTED: circadian clock-controlled protein-like [Dinoponera quadriceps]
MAPAKATFIAILLAMATIGALAQREIPEFLHVCDAGAELRKFEQCVVESIMKLQPYLKMGVPEYNIPLLEPLKLKRLTFTPTATLRIQAKDIDVYEASNFRISKLKTDVKNLYFHVDVSLPNIRVEGDYDVDGKILVLPIRGSGPFHGNFKNCTGSCRIQAEKYIDSDGVEKIRISDFKMKITVGRGTIKFDNLFNGEKALGDVVNSAINNNFEVFLKELIPLLEKALSDAFRVTADNIVTQFSFAQLFPNA